MAEIDNERAQVLLELFALAQNLYEALDGQNSQQILTAQQNLSTAVETAWTRASSETNISGKDKAIIRLLSDAAINELPEMIQNSANYAKIKQHLRLLKSSLVLLE